MEWDWVPIGIMLVLVGGFYLWSLYLAFGHGVKIGQLTPRYVPAMPSGKMRSVSIEGADMGRGTSTAPVMRCAECGQFNSHHKDCPFAKPKPRAERWKGFSSIRRALENQPEKENSNAS